METVEAPEDRSGDQQPAVGYRNPKKDQPKDQVVQGTPKGRTFEMMGAAEKRQRYKGSSLKRAVRFRKQETCY